MSEIEKEIYESAEKLVKILIEKQYTIATAESCTGGMISSSIIYVPGASWVLNESYVTYSNEAKQRLLGVCSETLDSFGAVSEQTAEEMVRGVADKANANCAVAVTGIAGPDGGTPDKPVGTVYVGFFIDNQVEVIKYNFSGDRLTVRQKTTKNVIDHMLNILENE